MSDGKLRKSARAVQAALDASGLDLEVIELEAATRTAQQAADALGCSVAQIAKSIIFRAETTGDAVLVIASGANRIDEAKIERHLGEALGRATPEFVRAATGFVIGGVPPCGHVRPLRAFVDEDLLELPELWAAAGTPRALFRLTPAQLVELTQGTTAEVK